jgi:hypothetical protein
MSLDVAPSQSIAQIERRKRKSAPRMHAKTRQAIELMVWEGMTRNQAAQATGMNPKSLYHSFLRPWTKAFYREQLEVLRSSERARNIHRLVEIRDAADNMHAVQAIAALERLEDQPHSSGSAQRGPGLQIVIVQNAQPSHTIPKSAHTLTIDGQTIDKADER